jgi:hypothetical protein
MMFDPLMDLLCLMDLDDVWWFQMLLDMVWLMCLIIYCLKIYNI